jgi:hypothetical protein
MEDLYQEIDTCKYTMSEFDRLEFDKTMKKTEVEAAAAGKLEIDLKPEEEGDGIEAQNETVGMDKLS